MALALGNLLLALSDVMAGAGRILAPRPAYWAIAGVATSLLAAALLIPVLSAMFQMRLPSASLLGASVAVAILAGGWPMVAARLSPPRNGVVHG